jgi:3-dehydroquinate dehydratase/shikimate dehydrogenase
MQSDDKAPVVICSVLERDASHTLRRIEDVPAGCGLVEIRADHLEVGDVEGLVRRAGRPVIVTIRPGNDVGRTDRPDADRLAILQAALAGGARFIDVEWGSALAGLADGEHAGRVILSHHGAHCDLSELLQIYQRMATTAAGKLKLVPRAESVEEASAVFDVLRQVGRPDRRLACFALGRPGAITRLLSISWGSWATYGSPATGLETAAGQFTARDMLETYDVLQIRETTRKFGLIGRAVFGSPSPAMHRTGYQQAGIDARYLPIELDDLDGLFGLLTRAGGVGLEGLAVTMPFKEPMAGRCELHDEVARLSGAVNTVIVDPAAWAGYNTDGPAAVAASRLHVDPSGARVAILGAGGTGRALAVAFASAGSRVTLFNRTEARAEKFASQVGISSAGADRFPEAEWDILINATPLGREGETVVSRRSLNGRLVIDACYAPEITPLVRDAAQSGLGVVDGLALLAGQAVLQFERMTGNTPSVAQFEVVARAWLAGRRAT